jgi:hypothetical protein
MGVYIGVANKAFSSLKRQVAAKIGVLLAVTILDQE